MVKVIYDLINGDFIREVSQTGGDSICAYK